MPVISTACGDVDLHEWGEGSPTIVMLQAAASSPRAIARLGQRLADGGATVLAPALAGYGATAELVHVDPIAAHVEVARAVLARERGPVVLFGHSMGGLIALRTALAMPDIAAVAVYEPVAFGVLDRMVEPEASAAAWDRRIAEVLIAKVDAGEQEVGVRTFVEAWNEVAWEALPEPVRRGLVAAAPRLRREVAAVTLDDAPAGIYTAIRVPVLILRGDRSPAAVRLIAERLHAGLPGSRLETLPGLGHMGPVLAPDAVAAAFTSFVRTSSAR
jgi:pimeloyl-ACP methyl ester carboxylesterase